jgi:RNA polymerase sigma factor (sigma-70 family)
MDPHPTAVPLTYLAAAARHDDGALERLLAEVHVHLVRYCTAWLAGSCPGHALVDDVVGDALMHVARGLGSCHANTDAEFLAWCRRIAKNAGLDLLRTAARQRRVQGVLAELTPGNAGEGPEIQHPAVCALLQCLEAVLAGESDEVQEILWRRLVQHDTWIAIGEALRSSPGACKRRYERTLGRLRRRIEHAVGQMPGEQQAGIQALLGNHSPARKIARCPDPVDVIPIRQVPSGGPC